MDINTILTNPLVVMLIALIIGLAEAIKRAGCPTRFIPIIDIAIGLIGAVGIFYFGYKYSLVETIVIGLLSGLSASGLFSGVKNTFKLGSSDGSEDQ